MRKFFKENRNQILLLIILPVIIFPWTAFGRSYFAGIDIAKLHQPMRLFDVQSVARGEFPLWNPHIFSGFPQFAEGESGFFYIGNLVQYLPVGFDYAYSLLILLHFALAGMIAYSCLRHFGLDKSISCAMSVVWAYSPFFMFHIGAPTILITLAWYPALIQLADSMPGRPVRRMGWLAILISQMVLAGSAQMAFFGITSYFVYAIIRWILTRRQVIGAAMKLVWIPLLACVLAFFIAAIQVLPTFEMLKYTERAGQVGEAFRVTGSWLDTARLAAIFIFPLISGLDELLHYGSSLLFIGMIPGILLLGGIFGGWRRNEIKVHLIAAAVIILLAMGAGNPFNFWMSHIPPFDRFRYIGRFAAFASWHLLVISGIWLSTVIERNPSGRFNPRKIMDSIGRPVIAAVILTIIFLIFNGISKFSALGIMFALVQLVVMALMLSRAAWRMHLMTAAAIFSLILAYPLGNLLQLEKAEYKRVMGIYARLDDERPSGRFFMEREGGLISKEGHGLLFLTPYKQQKAFAGGNAGSMEGLTVLSGYASLKMGSWVDVIQQAAGNSSDGIGRDELYGRIFADYIVIRDDVDVGGFEDVDDIDITGIADDAYLRRSVDPMEPVFVTTKYSGNGDRFETWQLGARSIGGGIQAYEKEKDRYRIEAACYNDCLLVLLDSWYPGWEAYVDGEESQVALVNGLFKGVELKKGEHTVEFRYHCAPLRNGMIISIIGMFFALLMIAIPSGRSVHLVK